jgi:hypothetical protein
MFRSLMLGALASASLAGLAFAQSAPNPANVERPTGSVVGVVQGEGSQRPVTDVHVNQNTKNNVAGVMQAGGNPSASVNQSGGGSNFGMVNQMGDSTRAKIDQKGRTNNAQVGQSGNNNRSSIHQRQ